MEQMSTLPAVSVQAVVMFAAQVDVVAHIDRVRPTCWHLHSDPAIWLRNTCCM